MWKVGEVDSDPYPEDLDPEVLGQLMSSKVKFFAAKFSAAGLMGTLSGSPGEVVASPADLETCNADSVPAARCIYIYVLYLFILTCFS